MRLSTMFRFATILLLLTLVGVCPAIAQEGDSALDEPVLQEREGERDGDTAQDDDTPAPEVPLFLVDENTTVSDISFRFDSTRTFDETRLRAQIATTKPGFLDRVKRVLPLVAATTHPFSALELQRDVARLRLYYNEHGFPRVSIDYSRSRLDTTRNALHVVFTIHEGEPVVVRELRFFSLQGDPFPNPDEDEWDTFTDAIEIEPGDRYSEPDRIATQSQALDWFRNHGYAFATIRDSVLVDSTALAADLNFVVDPGPLAYFDEIDVEGNESVSRQVIVRELPFRQGERYSNAQLRQGQREIFGLNLFRTALADLPGQSRDSTVSVRVRVREARPQLVTYQLGYGREAGAQLEGQYIHRNFLGAARTLTASLVTNTGFGGAPTGDRVQERLIRATVALRQPYLFVTHLSGTVAPFFQIERDQQLEESEKLLGVNAQEYGLTTTLLYEVLPFRTISLQHTFSRASIFTVPTTTTRATDRFNRSILTLSGTFGRSDDYISPTSGVLVRPVAEIAGRVFGSGVQYYKVSNEVTAYTPLGRDLGLAGRVLAGRLWPVGGSRNQIDPVIENRFDPIRFYAGGGTDLRGWGDRLAGPKRARPSVAGGDTLGFVYEPIGGLAKLAANVEVRLPFPGLGPSWGTAVFLDAARLSEGRFALDDFRYGTGLGIRYRTPVGFVRLDLAYKLNPDPQDLRSAEAYFDAGEDADARAIRRFKIHLSIGQAF